MRLVNGTSRLLGRGQGTVAGGRVALGIDPDLVAALSAHRRVVLISGTNGKTTTTKLASAALVASGLAPHLVTNSTGSNMVAGHVAALAERPFDGLAVLECDEAYLARTAAGTGAEVVALLNLSRDQLDRSSEVRKLVSAWRALLEASSIGVVANADDPLVVAAARGARSVRWVAGGLRWRLDAVGCPLCEGRIAFEEAPSVRWRCESCDLERPAPSVEATGGGDALVVVVDGRRLVGSLRLPGAFNRSNAAFAIAICACLGADLEAAMTGIASVEEVAGRFSTVEIEGVPTELLLAKNPAGWGELLSLVTEGTSPVVLSINARIADGLDPSWLYDVDFEQLAGRPVVVTGERRHDLAVRLHYGEVAHQVVAEPAAAVALAASLGDAPVVFIGNYTAFGDLRRLVR